MDSLRHLLRLFFGKGVFSASQTFRRNPRSTDALPTTDIRHFIFSHIAFNWSELNSIFYPFQWLYVYIPGFQSKNTAEIECWLDDSHRVVAKANSQPPGGRQRRWCVKLCSIMLNHVLIFPPAIFKAPTFPKQLVVNATSMRDVLIAMFNCARVTWKKCIRGNPSRSPMARSLISPIQSQRRTSRDVASKNVPSFNNAWLWVVRLNSGFGHTIKTRHRFVPDREEGRRGTGSRTILLDKIKCKMILNKDITKVKTHRKDQFVLRCQYVSVQNQYECFIWVSDLTV